MFTWFMARSNNHQEAAMQTASAVEQVREILARENITEASGEWSAYDVARELDPEAHKPTHAFDTGRQGPRSEYVSLAEEAIARIVPGSRYVGGVSGHLYSL